jgi:hypothetical protein
MISGRTKSFSRRLPHSSHESDYNGCIDSAWCLRREMPQPAKIPYREAMNPDHDVGDGARLKSTSEYANGITCHAGKHTLALSGGADSGRASSLLENA